jgi:hypothetical protein
MKDDGRPHLRLVVGRGDGGRAPRLHPPSGAGPWHPSRGGRPPLVVVPRQAAPGERARLQWWRRSACEPAATTTAPPEATPGILIEMAAWR